ncbi:MAG: SpoIIE family protein phosphatase [bacterium]
MALWLIGEHRGQILRQELKDGDVRVGRGSACEIVLPSQTVSRHHATIRARNDTLHVTDHGSLNGTRVNGRPVDGEAVAHAGDLIEFGSVLLRLSDHDESIAPMLSDDSQVSAHSVYLSKDEITDSHRKVGADSAVLHLLMEAGQLLVLPESPERTFDRLLELVESAIPARRILLLLQEEKGKDPVQRAARVQGDRVIAPLLLSRTMMRTVIDQGTAILTADAQMDQRFQGAQSIVGQDLRSAMAVPLVYNEEILGLLYLDTADPTAAYTEHDLRVLTVLAQMLGGKIANARLLDIAREQEILRHELETAAAIQRRLLPQQMPVLERYDVVARQRTCEAVGGDLYDGCVLPDERVQVCLGDVSGKGIAAALLMSNVLATIRALRSYAAPPKDLVARLDRQLQQSTDDEHYVTFFLAELDPVSSRLECVNAGHPSAYLVHPDRRLERLDAVRAPVGFPLPEIPFEAPTIEMPPGSSLVVYSDGVSEALRGSEQFGDERFPIVLRESAGMCAADMMSRIERELDAWVGDTPAADDITLLIVQRKSA